MDDALAVQLDLKAAVRPGYLKKFELKEKREKHQSIEM
jgi:hypothetical protein